MNKLLKTVVVTAAMTLFSISALAAEEGTVTSTLPKPTEAEGMDEWRPHLGVIAGLTSPESTFDNAVEFGLDVGFQPIIPIGYGIELSTSAAERKSREDDLSRTKLLGRATYNFGGDTPVIRHSYLGAVAGAVWDTTSDRTATNFGWGPLAGFDIPIGWEVRKSFSLGLNAKYLMVAGGATDAFSLNGMMKYWF